MTPFDLLYKEMREYANTHQSQRLGQAYFNALHEQAPELADRIRGTDVDPFYDDARVGPFLGRVNLMMINQANRPGPLRTLP